MPSAESRWHALSTEDVLRELDSEPGGLSSARALERLQQDGPNTIQQDAGTSVFVVVGRQFRSPLIAILVVAAVLTAVLGDYVDTGVILVVLLFNAVIGTFQEVKAEHAVRALQSMVSPHARVLRDAAEHVIETAEVVRGDVVLLESGARVPADLRLLTSTGLTMDESLLTGESETVLKNVEPVGAATMLAERSSMAYAGSVVASGRARGVVVATGDGTEVGGIAGLMRGEAMVQTPLQRRMAGFARVVGFGVAVLSILAFAIGIVRGEGTAEMFRVAVAMAVSAVPEGLPVAFTITLALGVRRMAARNAIVRSLPAVETLGSTTVIGSDKTGTLTENRMTVLEVWTWDGSLDLQQRQPATPLSEPVRRTLLAGIFANEAEPTGPGGYAGDPTEVALLEAAAEGGIDLIAERDRNPQRIEIPFEPLHQFSGSVRGHSPTLSVYVKGAPERVSAMCARMLGNGGEVAMDPDAVREAAEAIAGRGLRVLAMAGGPAEGADSAGTLGLRTDLTFYGLEAMMDPPREGVAGAIAACHAAGIRVVMITGDHSATALAIGRQLDIESGQTEALTGVDIDLLDDSELDDRCRRVNVYARMTPAQKLRVVHSLRRTGETVAVTGDGINDAPALRAADIGIAMGRGGTDVAREAADMVLADDNFVSIQAAVEEGRVTFDNLRKVTFFLISTGVAEVIAIITALALGWPLPFLAAQILWLNLVTNGLQDIALAFEPGEPDVLQRPPRPRAEGLLSRLLWERSLLVGLTMAVGTLLVFDWQLGRGETEEVARTAALTTMVLFQCFHVGNARTERQSLFVRSPFSNPFLFLCTAAALAFHLAAVYSPLGARIFNFEPLPLETWLVILPCAASIVAVVEVHKFLRRRRQVVR